MKFSKHILFLVSILFLAGGGAALAEPEPEMWKGPSPEENFNFGAMMGAAIMDGSAGFALVGQGAMKILNRGFISPDLNDQVFIEIELGPTFIRGTTVASYGVHLRWDFNKDDVVTLYAIGGFGGSFAGSALANQVEFYPRFGVGAFYHFSDLMSLRAEVSHELLAIGISFEL